MVLYRLRLAHGQATSRSWESGTMTPKSRQTPLFDSDMTSFLVCPHCRILTTRGTLSSEDRMERPCVLLPGAV